MPCKWEGLGGPKGRADPHNVRQYKYWLSETQQEDLSRIRQSSSLTQLISGMCSDDILGCQLLSHLARQAVGDAPVLVDLRQLVQLVRAGGRALLLLLHLFEDVGLLSIPAC